VNPPSNFKKSLRKALATFLFSTLGMLVGVNILDVDIATWKLVASTGIGSVLNLVYRWSEAVVKEPLDL
jgi:hypothetical protein